MMSVGRSYSYMEGKRMNRYNTRMEAREEKEKPKEANQDLNKDERTTYEQ